MAQRAHVRVEPTNQSAPLGACHLQRPLAASARAPALPPRHHRLTAHARQLRLAYRHVRGCGSPVRDLERRQPHACHDLASAVSVDRWKPRPCQPRIRSFSRPAKFWWPSCPLFHCSCMQPCRERAQSGIRMSNRSAQRSRSWKLKVFMNPPLKSTVRVPIGRLNPSPNSAVP